MLNINAKFIFLACQTIVLRFVFWQIGKKNECNTVTLILLCQCRDILIDYATLELKNLFIILL